MSNAADPTARLQGSSSVAQRHGSRRLRGNAAHARPSPVGTKPPPASSSNSKSAERIKPNRAASAVPGRGVVLLGCVIASRSKQAQLSAKHRSEHYLPLSDSLVTHRRAVPFSWLQLAHLGKQNIKICQNLYTRKQTVSSMAAQCQNLLRRLFSELEK